MPRDTLPLTQPAAAAASIHLDPASLRPLIAAVVAEALQAVDVERSRIGFTEAEAARMLGLNPWQLRDERLRGRIAASVIVGGKIRYARSDLERYLAERRVSGSDGVEMRAAT